LIKKPPDKTGFKSVSRVNPAKTSELARFSLETDGYNSRNSSPYSPVSWRSMAGFLLARASLW
jgi:hypothetical protein